MHLSRLIHLLQNLKGKTKVSENSISNSPTQRWNQDLR
jgi:hypothetical protein